MSDPESPESPVTLLRTARGKQPRHFANVEVDRLLAIIVSLVGEVSVLRDRLDALERVSEKHGVLARDEIEHFVPTADEQVARSEWRARYLERVFRVVQAERDELVAGREVDLDRVIDDFTAGRI